MSRLIFIAGMMGSGKSTTADRFEKDAFCIHADQIQYDAARRAFPFIKKSREYSWSAWPRDIETMYIHSLIHVSVEAVAIGIRDHRGHLLVEGAILSNNWFRIPLRDVFCSFGHEFAAPDVNFLHLDPPAQTIYKQIHARADQHDYRRHEKAMFPSVQAVQQHKDGYAKSFAAGLWTVCESNDALDDTVRKIFASAQ